MQTLVESNISLNVTWATPISNKITTSLSLKNAEIILDTLEPNIAKVGCSYLRAPEHLLLTEPDEETSILRLEDTLLGLNLGNRSFEFRSIDGVKYRGKISSVLFEVSSYIPANVIIEIEKQITIISIFVVSQTSAGWNYVR
ncbi:hypothetical protein [Desulfosporosinus nitroreducens]|uniref:hypothetical protein n=1 Tax=Desulfosporosinus nitroreducens TaxID=2018668 RepID=UPI00207CBD7D|nr:hypothetical protein [Desulfosporosinus nitroreducens]MCO1602105.1 hypothetical protein [Desulfosporosinus nitroreducens]